MTVLGTFLTTTFRKLCPDLLACSVGCIDAVVCVCI